MTTSSRAVVLAALAAIASPAPAAEPAWRVASPEFAWSFPRDHWAHPGYRTEWWYVTGHVASTADPSRAYGYQFTIFRIGVLPEKPEIGSAWAASDLVMGHAAVTDLV